MVAIPLGAPLLGRGHDRGCAVRRQMVQDLGGALEESARASLASPLRVWRN